MGPARAALPAPARVRTYRVRGKQSSEQLLTPHRSVPPYVRWQTAGKLRRVHRKQRVQILAANKAQSHNSARAAADTLAQTVAGLVPSVASGWRWRDPMAFGAMES